MVEIRGAPPRVEAAVRAELEPLLGTSLVRIDRGDLARRLEALPIVHAAEVDRAFPHTLSLLVRAERPLAVVRVRGVGAWVVSEHGRVLERATMRALTRFPLIALPPGVELQPGEVLESTAALTALDALRALPRPFPIRVRSARAQLGRIVLVVGTGAELRLGEPIDLRLKLAVAERLLRSIPPDERAELDYVDLSLPARPVAA